MKNFSELEKIKGQKMRLGEFKKIFKEWEGRKIANKLQSVMHENEHGVIEEYFFRSCLIDVVLEDGLKCFVTIEFNNNVETHNDYVENEKEDMLYITIKKVEKREFQD